MGGMKVGVIAGEMEGRSTGVGRYLSGLFSGLSQWENGVEWHLFFQGDQVELPTAVAESAELHFSGNRGRRFLWEHVLVAREMAPFDLDLIFGPANSLPFGCRTPAVVTIHDLSFEMLPEEFQLRERWRRRLLARRAARVARRVFAVSTSMAEMLCRRYNVPASNVVVVPNGVDLRRFSTVSESGDHDVVSSIGAQIPYILWTGTVLERRMPGLVLEALAAVRRDHPDLKLVIAGENRMRSPERFTRLRQSLGLDDAVSCLGWVEEDCLAPLYRCAELGIYVSRHEGFGIPPLECLACGTPVVVSEGLALDDAWPDYPHRVENLTAAGIEKQIRAVLDVRGESRGFAAAAQPVLEKFGWRAASRQLVDGMQSAVTS
jgi:glycosyltransferase involved in cell wall biosynthesis